MEYFMAPPITAAKLALVQFFQLLQRASKLWCIRLVNMTATVVGPQVTL